MTNTWYSSIFIIECMDFGAASAFRAHVESMLRLGAYNIECSQVIGQGHDEAAGVWELYLADGSSFIFVPEASKFSYLAKHHLQNTRDNSITVIDSRNVDTVLSRRSE